MDFTKLASDSSIKKTRASLVKKGYEVEVFETGKLALKYIKTTIPKGASVMNGASVTLEQIGYLKYLKSGKHGWVDLHAKVNAENDQEKRANLRKQSVLSEYYLGSVHGLAENGEFVIASNTGSQLPHIVFTSTNLIFVVSTKKIVPTINDAMKRLIDHVIPLENKHMMDLYKVRTSLNKIVIFKGENPMLGRKIRFLLVKEDLGF
jgi:L-lactate utilization protein LutC